MTKQSEVEGLAEALESIAFRSDVNNNDHLSVARAILDEGYLHRNRLELDVEQLAIAMYNSGKIIKADGTGYYSWDDLYDSMKQYFLNRACSIAAAKDEIIKVSGPKKEE